MQAKVSYKKYRLQKSIRIVKYLKHQLCKEPSVNFRDSYSNV